MTKTNIVAVGDIFLGGGVAELTAAKGKSYCFKAIASSIKTSNIAIGNLESPVCALEADSRAGYLPPPPSLLDGVKNAGFNAVSLANNHTLDFGRLGLQQTITALKERDIGYAGAGFDEASARQPLTIPGNPNIVLLSYYGKKMGMVNNQGYTNGAQVDRVLAEIEQAQAKNTVVIVAIHWGGYCRQLPQQHQVDFARQMIDSGAKIVIGSGSHTLQPVEQYHGGVIAYSLGNFVFDSQLFDPPKPETRASMMLKISLAGTELANVAIEPVYLNDEHCPELVDRDRNPQLFERISSLLVDRLDTCESDSQTALSILTRNKLRPITTLKKLLFPSQRAHNLSFYFNSLMQLIKEKLSTLKSFS